MEGEGRRAFTSILQMGMKDPVGMGAILNPKI